MILITFLKHILLIHSSSLIIKQKYGDASALLQPKTTIHTLDDDLEHLQKLIIDAYRIPLVCKFKFLYISI